MYRSPPRARVRENTISTYAHCCACYLYHADIPLDRQTDLLSTEHCPQGDNIENTNQLCTNWRDIRRANVAWRARAMPPFDDCRHVGLLDRRLYDADIPVSRFRWTLCGVRRRGQGR